MRCVADFFRTDTRKLVVLLAVAAGAADAILIVRFDVLTAAQTGNTILLAVALATGNWPTGAAAGLSVAGFLAGAILGAWLLRRVGVPVSRVLVLEILLLAGVTAGWSLAGTLHPAVELPIVAATAAAMGLQSLVMLHSRSLSTTYVTGVLAAFARDTVSPPGPDAPQGRDARFEAAVWLVYFAGAVMGALLLSRFGAPALMLSITCLAAASIIASRSRPEI